MVCPQQVCKLSSHPQTDGHVRKILVQSASHRPVRKIDTTPHGGLILARGDHFWQPKSVRPDQVWQQKWSGGTGFGRFSCQNQCGRTNFRGDRFWHYRSYKIRTSLYINRVRILVASEHQLVTLPYVLSFYIPFPLHMEYSSIFLPPCLWNILPYSRFLYYVLFFYNP